MPKEKPKRIQRKRTAGWRMPENCVYVGRPTVWGNPFVVNKKSIAYMSKKRSVLYFRECLERAINKQIFPADPSGGILPHETIDHFRRMAAQIHDIRGKDLACFCQVDCECHADVLLELANR